MNTQQQVQKPQPIRTVATSGSVGEGGSSSPQVVKNQNKTTNSLHCTNTLSMENVSSSTWVLTNNNTNNHNNINNNLNHVSSTLIGGENDGAQANGHYPSQPNMYESSSTNNQTFHSSNNGQCTVSISYSVDGNGSRPTFPQSLPLTNYMHPSHHQHSEPTTQSSPPLNSGIMRQPSSNNLPMSNSNNNNNTSRVSLSSPSLSLTHTSSNSHHHSECYNNSYHNNNTQSSLNSPFESTHHLEYPTQTTQTFQHFPTSINSNNSQPQQAQNSHHHVPHPPHGQQQTKQVVVASSNTVVVVPELSSPSHPMVRQPIQVYSASSNTATTGATTSTSSSPLQQQQHHHNNNNIISNINMNYNTEHHYHHGGNSPSSTNSINTTFPSSLANNNTTITIDRHVKRDKNPCIPHPIPTFSTSMSASYNKEPSTPSAMTTYAFHSSPPSNVITSATISNASTCTQEVPLTSSSNNGASCSSNLPNNNNNTIMDTSSSNPGGSQPSSSSVIISNVKSNSSMDSQRDGYSSTSSSMSSPTNNNNSNTNTSFQQPERKKKRLNTSLPPTVMAGNHHPHAGNQTFIPIQPHPSSLPLTPLPPRNPHSPNVNNQYAHHFTKMVPYGTMISSQPQPHGMPVPVPFYPNPGFTPFPTSTTPPGPILPPRIMSHSVCQHGLSPLMVQQHQQGDAISSSSSTSSNSINQVSNFPTSTPSSQQSYEMAIPGESCSTIVKLNVGLTLDKFHDIRMKKTVFETFIENQRTVNDGKAGISTESQKISAWRLKQVEIYKNVCFFRFKLLEESKPELQTFELDKNGYEINGNAMAKICETGPSRLAFSLDSYGKRVSKRIHKEKLVTCPFLITLTNGQKDFTKCVCVHLCINKREKKTVITRSDFDPYLRDKTYLLNLISQYASTNKRKPIDEDSLSSDEEEPLKPVKKEPQGGSYAELRLKTGPSNMVSLNCVNLKYNQPFVDPGPTFNWKVSLKGSEGEVDCNILNIVVEEADINSSISIYFEIPKISDRVSVVVIKYKDAEQSSNAAFYSLV